MPRRRPAARRPQAASSPPPRRAPNPAKAPTGRLDGLCGRYKGNGLRGSSTKSTVFVSTGHLPAPPKVRLLVDEAHARFAGVDQGSVSDVYPALARVPAELYGICVTGTDGSICVVGEADHPFTIMSVSKPFVFALV